MRRLVIVLLGILLQARTGAFAQYDRAAPEPVGKIRGSLVVHGGGNLQDSICDRFVELAGGRSARLVIIPTASADADAVDEPDRFLACWRARNPEGLELLHTRDREAANTEVFLAPLRQATGVWFVGGDQSRLESAYAETVVEAAVQGVLGRGGVVGGSSAGAAFLTRVMIDRGEIHCGLDLLPGGVIDQHFIVRNRQERLCRVLAQRPGLVGFGVDEGAAMIVRGRSIEIAGDSDVVICMAPSQTRPQRIERLSPGRRVDLIALSRAAVARSQAPFPPAVPAAPELAAGSLVIAGGGPLPTGMLQRFVELAGGANAPIVYIPCEQAEVIPREPGFCRELRKAGANNVQWIHTKDRARANCDAEFLQPLVQARGIWFGGGRQWNLVDSYQNTTAHRLMHEVLARGGVIGGSSAGASIQGDYMPRGDPLGNLNIIAEGYERGLGFLTGVAIDQHFTQRKRHSDMTSLIRTYPQLLGIGIDEGTALVVEGHAAAVVGSGEVAFYDAQLQADDSAKDHVSLHAGQRFDLKARLVIEDR
jgi:cyanophycinase